MFPAASIGLGPVHHQPHHVKRRRAGDVEAVQLVAADGIHCYDPDGTLIGKVKVPEVTANCVFGGNKLNCLYIAGTTSLYMVRLMVNGAKTF